MHVIAGLRASHLAASSGEFLAACAELEKDARALIGRRYSEAALSSECARKSFVPPDREPLPLLDT